MNKVKVGLRPIVRNINLPTVLKTAILPGDFMERLFIATQVGEIFYIGNGGLRYFLDIRSQIIALGRNGGYDERGLIGLAFHPLFYINGLFYLHYSVAGTQGPGAPHHGFNPDPCNPETLHLKWTDREAHYDHIDTVEEWILQANGAPQRRRTLLNLRRPFMNHNGVNSLNFSPETGKLVLTTGDGGSGYDPFNLSQDDLEIAGKIIEIDVGMDTQINHPPNVTRFDELPTPIQKTLTVMAKGVRNIPGISFQRFYDRYIKYVGNVGQDLVESIFSFDHYQPIPVTRLVQASSVNAEPINFGWRGWEGTVPTSVRRSCTENPDMDENTIAYYNEAVPLSGSHLQPLTNYFHQDPRPDRFAGTALTGVQVYMGDRIPALTGSVVFSDLARRESKPQGRGALAYTYVRQDRQPNDFGMIEIDYDFGTQPAYFTSLGTNLNQTSLYIGVYGSMNVTNLHQGTIFEIIP